MSYDSDNELYETGTEPEFFVQCVAKAEACDGVMRVYFSSRRHEHLRLEFTALLTPTAAAEIGRALLDLKTPAALELSSCKAGALGRAQ